MHHSTESIYRDATNQNAWRNASRKKAIYLIDKSSAKYVFNTKRAIVPLHVEKCWIQIFGLRNRYSGWNFRQYRKNLHVAWPLSRFKMNPENAVSLTLRLGSTTSHDSTSYRFHSWKNRSTFGEALLTIIHSSNFVASIFLSFRWHLEQAL